MTHPAVDATIDPMYIQPSESTGMVLVSSIFDGTGYYSWKRKIVMALSAMNKIGFIDGSIRQPDSGSPNLRNWECCNAMVACWLLNAMTKEIADSFLFTGSARDIWVDLESRFSQSNAAQMYAVAKNLRSISQESDNIAGYFARINKLWYEEDSITVFPACTCGAAQEIRKYKQELRVLQFLMGLSDSFSAIRGSILLMSPIPDINHVYYMLNNEEKQQESKSNGRFSTDASSLAVGNGNKFRRRKDNQKQQSQGPNGQQKRSLFCSHCKKSNHTVDRCYKLNGFPADYKQNKGSKIVAQTSDRFCLFQG